MNKYVDFVSDEVFLECVESVCDVYPKDRNQMDTKEFHKNVIDPFKAVFDIANLDIGSSEWIKAEQMRQKDKTVNNKIGEFHQKLLGNVEGWIDLGIGDKSQVDLKKEDNSIFIELKNKHNTMNSDATNACRNKLDKVTRQHKKCTAYWAYLIGKNGSSGDQIWCRRGEKNNRIRKIWGWKVYELITGDPRSLENTWDAIPSAISDSLGKGVSFKSEDKIKLKEFYRYAFKNKE